jgi:hypothetical protein
MKHDSIRFAIEGLVNGQWSREHVGSADDTTLFDSLADAEVALDELEANGFGPRQTLRVVEVASDDMALTLPEDAVIVETMPEHHRGSHRAARNWGTYPHNGAERRIMSRSEAECEVEADADGYASIVRDATEADVTKYEVQS